MTAAMNETLRLAQAFPPPDREAWLALVAKTLKGAGADSLARRTADGLVLPALGDSVASPRVLEPRPLRAPLEADALAWDIRALVPTSEPSAARDEARETLEGGASSLLLRIEGDPADIPAILQDVAPEIAAVALDPGAAGRTAARALDSAARASPTARLAFHLDPLSAFAEAGAWPGGLGEEIRACAALAARLAEIYPRSSLCLASGQVAHEAGATPAQEIAFAAAAAVAYARAMTAAGLPPAEAFSRLTFGLAVEPEPFAAIAKLRAARAVFARLSAAGGVEAPVRLEARASRRALTRAEPWTNLVRLTAAAFAAAVGGADAVMLEPHDAWLGGGDAQSLRLARNVQLVLMAEGQIGRVADPAGGAWALESHSDALARAAWREFRRIEAAGGLAEALQSGDIALAVGQARDALILDYREGRRRLLGITDFAPSVAPLPAPAQRPRPPADPSPGGAGVVCPPLTPVRLEDLAQEARA